MTPFEKYVFILCLIVFILLTSVFSTMLAVILRLNLRLIASGAEDERIFREYSRSSMKGKDKAGWLGTVITVVFACLVVALFTFTTTMQATESKVTASIPSVRVVYSDSMSKKYKKNQYLFDNDLNDQFARFDLIVTYQLPKEEDLQLYDIVVYEVEDTLLVHRIVGIEEPNAKHPDKRLFVLQGDNVANPDKEMVSYDQMKAIYTGDRVQFVGSFVLFLQSPAGYMCFILMAVEMIASPWMRRKIEKAELARMGL